MMIRVKPGSEGININIPISLLVLDQTFDALEDLVWLWEKLFSNSMSRTHWHDNDRFAQLLTKMNLAGAPSQLLGLCREVIDELRSYGRWRMVEVEINNPKSPVHERHRGKVRVYIDFI